MGSAFKYLYQPNSLCSTRSYWDISKLQYKGHFSKLETSSLYVFSLILGPLGDQGLHIGDWNNLQTGCPHPAEKGRAAEEKGQRGPGTETGTEWGAQTGQVGQKKKDAYFDCNATDFLYLARVRYDHGWYLYVWFISSSSKTSCTPFPTSSTNKMAIFTLSLYQS